MRRTCCLCLGLHSRGDDEEPPEIVNAAGLAGIIFGGLFGFKARKRHRALRGEREAIGVRMREIGVHFCDSPAELHVYAGKRLDENLVTVLRDESYR